MRFHTRGVIVGCACAALLLSVPHIAEATSVSTPVSSIGNPAPHPVFAAVRIAPPRPTDRPEVGTSQRGGVTISPAFQQITLRPDIAIKTFDFAVTNNSSQEYEFALSVVDFGSLDETGGVLFVGNAEKALSYRYALSPWVTLEKDRVVVAPHTTEKVPITLTNKESLTPGGHYGAVLVTPTETGSATSQKVQIDQVASSLMFVKKLGGEVYSLNLSSFTARTRLISLPTKVDLRFQNTGNVHVTPHGIATLTDPRGRVVKRAVINADSGIVMPETFRSIRAPFQQLASSWLPGRYKLSVAYRYDDQTTFRTVESSFLYVNIVCILMLVGLVGIAMLLIVRKDIRSFIWRWLWSIGGRLRWLTILRRRRP